MSTTARASFPGIVGGYVVHKHLLLEDRAVIVASAPRGSRGGSRYLIADGEFHTVKRTNGRLERAWVFEKSEYFEPLDSRELLRVFEAFAERARQALHDHLVEYEKRYL